MSSCYSSSPCSVSSVLSIWFGKLVVWDGFRCLAVSDVLCADVWLSAMSCVRMSGCQRCLVCGCLAVSDVLCADVWLSAMSCVRLVTAIWNRDHNQQQYLFFYVISLLLFRYLCVIQYVASKIDFSFFLNITSEGSCRNFWGNEFHRIGPA